MAPKRKRDCIVLAFRAAKRKRNCIMPRSRAPKRKRNCMVLKGCVTKLFATKSSDQPWCNPHSVGVAVAGRGLCCFQDCHDLLLVITLIHDKDTWSNLQVYTSVAITAPTYLRVLVGVFAFFHGTLIPVSMQAACKRVLGSLLL